MAVEPGFPWQAPAREPEKDAAGIPVPITTTSQAQEKKQEVLPASPVKTNAAHQNDQSRKHSNSLHGRAHRGSLKAPPRVNYSVPNPPPESIASKPNSVLPVRTIPRKSWSAEQDR